MKHLFMTGEKQVGKSTLLNRLLLQLASRYPDRYGEKLRIGGFRTVRADLEGTGNYGVYLLRVLPEPVCPAAADEMTGPEKEGAVFSGKTAFGGRTAAGHTDGILGSGGFLAESPSPERLLFPCGQKNRTPEVMAKARKRFETMGIELLAPYRTAAQAAEPGTEADGKVKEPDRMTAFGYPQLILMDELGPNEAEAVGFQAAVRAVLDGPIPVWGVLQQADASFLKEIAGRSDVTVYTVTRENRDVLLQQIMELLPETAEDS